MRMIFQLNFPFLLNPIILMYLQSRLSINQDTYNFRKIDQYNDVMQNKSIDEEEAEEDEDVDEEDED